MVVLCPRLSMLSDGHEDLDEANDTFRRVRVPALKMSHPWVRKRCGSYGLNSIKKFRTRARTLVAVLEYTLVLISVAVPVMESPPPSCQP